jgi:DNA-binding transcriptional ArsR family regulator
MSGFSEHYNKSFRLALLRLLHEMPGYSANAAVLNSGADSLGFKVSRDQVMTQLDWLTEQGLTTSEDLGPVRVMTLTGRGSDVAQGRITATGVDRPSAKG